MGTQPKSGLLSEPQWDHTLTHWHWHTDKRRVNLSSQFCSKVHTTLDLPEAAQSHYFLIIRLSPERVQSAYGLVMWQSLSHICMQAVLSATD